MESVEIMESLNLLDDRVGEIEKQLPVINERYQHMNELFQKNIAVLDKLEESFQDNRLAMQAITTRVEQSSKEMAEMETDIETLKNERSFNIMAWFKSNFINIATLVAIGTFILKQSI